MNHMSGHRPSRLALTNAIALSSASGVGSRSPALIRGTRAPAVCLAQHLGVAPLKSEAYGKNKASSRIRLAPRVKVVESMRIDLLVDLRLKGALLPCSCGVRTTHMCISYTPCTVRLYVPAS